MKLRTLCKHPHSLISLHYLNIYFYLLYFTELCSTADECATEACNKSKYIFCIDRL